MNGAIWPNDCDNCKHWKPWTDEEWEQFLRKIYDAYGLERPKSRYNFGWCDKIPKDTVYYCEEGHDYKYDGYSFADECYDEDLHCFEPLESEEKQNV